MSQYKSMGYDVEMFRSWSSGTANNDKKLNVYKPCETSRKTVFRNFCKIFSQFSRCYKFW